jgi:hypothetical protein
VPPRVCACRAFTGADVERFFFRLSESCPDTVGDDVRRDRYGSAIRRQSLFTAGRMRHFVVSPRR